MNTYEVTMNGETETVTASSEREACDKAFGEGSWGDSSNWGVRIEKLD